MESLRRWNLCLKVEYYSQNTDYLNPQRIIIKFLLILMISSANNSRSDNFRRKLKVSNVNLVRLGISIILIYGNILF